MDFSSCVEREFRTATYHNLTFNIGEKLCALLTCKYVGQPGSGDAAAGAIGRRQFNPRLPDTLVELVLGQSGSIDAGRRLASGTFGIEPNQRME